MQTGGARVKLIVRGEEPSIAGHTGTPEAVAVGAVVVVDPGVVEVVDPLSAVVEVLEVVDVVDVVVVVEESVARVVSDERVVSVTDGSVVDVSSVEVGNAAEVSDPDAPEGTVESVAAGSSVASGVGSFTATVTLSSRWLYAPTPTAPAITAKAKHVTNAVRLMGFGEATA
jgi:hypothetical protein